eukprot:TRINITY_DN3521_c1_g1_i1.p1 TRINITY_DN3521_c1_g1~~TRINITY_DN3521_c1_g1_i1.p1  ORF type:complete len:351 (-),score=39.93 TRINITY_DN3521_c1_g1_i1:120-1172(-)
MEELSTWRRAKKYINTDTLAKPDRIRQYVPKKVHSVFQSGEGACWMDFHNNRQNLVAVCSGVGRTKLFDLTNERVVQEVDIGSRLKKVMFLTEQTLIASGEDGGCRVVGEQNGELQVKHVVLDQLGQSATDIAMHPSGVYFVSCYQDSRWSFNDVTIGECLQTFKSDNNSTYGYSCARFHPDGLIFALGSSSKQVHIWEMRNRSLAARFDGHTGVPVSVAFSENGIHMATGDDSGAVFLWDLRKYRVFHQFQPYQDNEVARSLQYDTSGRYLGCTGSQGTKIYGIKQDYGLLCAQQGLRAPGGQVLKFQENALQVIVGGGAGEVMVLGEAEGEGQRYPQMSHQSTATKIV